MKKTVKQMLTTSLASLMIFGGAFTSLASWEQQQDSSWKYKDDTSGVYVTSQWIESEIEKGLWYYINDSGIMATNAWIDDTYYVNELGEWRDIGEVDWTGLNNSDLSLGGPISESEKASGQNFVNHR